jgi:hypothetical protein
MVVHWGEHGLIRSSLARTSSGRDFPDLVWKKEDQLWKLLREGLKPQLISLCTEHKVDATGTMPEMRGRIAPELKRKGLLSRCTEEQIAELINKK